MAGTLWTGAGLVNIVPEPYDVTKYGVLPGAPDQQTAINDVATLASTAGGGVLKFPAGSYLISGDIELPVGVSMWCPPGADRAIIQGSGTNVLRVTGVPLTQRNGTIENMSLVGVGVLLGDTTSEWGVGYTIRNVEISYVTGNGVEYRHHSYLTVLDNAHIHNCTNGVYFDLAGAYRDSGVQMQIVNSKIHDVTNCVVVNGNTLDGHHIVISGTDLEHASDCLLKTISCGEGIIIVRDCNLERCFGYFIENDGSYVHLDGFRALTGSEKAWVYSKSGAIFIRNGRGSWNVTYDTETPNYPGTSRFAKMTGGTVVVDQTGIFCEPRWFGDNAYPMVESGSSGGHIVAPRTPLVGRSGEGLANIHTDGTGSPPYNPYQITLAHPYDGNEQTLEFTVQCTSVSLTGSNILRVDIGNGLGTVMRCDLSFPLYDGIARLRISYIPDDGMYVDGVYSGTTPGATTTQGVYGYAANAFTTAHTKYLVLSSVTYSGSRSTMNLKNLWQYISGPREPGL